MNDIGFQGFVELNGTLRIRVLCRNSSDVLTTPDADPTYKIIDKDGATVQTGTLTVNEGSVTGYQAASESVTSARGYTSGETYGIVILYDISAASMGASGTFSVQ